MGVQSNLHSQVSVDLDATNTVLQVGTSPIVYAVEVDNLSNSVPVFLHMWNAASPPGVAADGLADVCVKVPASTKMKVVLNGQTGHDFDNQCEFAVVTAANGATAPTNDVKATVYTDGN